MSNLSYHSQTANGSNIAFTITSFSEDEIQVYVDGVESTNGGSSQNDYTIPNYTTTGGTVTWNTTGSLTAPASPSIVRIIRQTDVLNNGNTAVEGKAVFQPGSSIKAADLNNNSKQALRAIHERQEQKIQRYDIEDGEVVRSKIAADAVDGTKIADDAVDSEHIAADSIDTEHYAANSVDATAIGPNAVTTVKILNDNVTMEKLGSGALPTDITVNTDNIVNQSIQTVDIGDNQITNALIADDQIDSEHYVDGSIDHQHLSNDCIDSDNIQDNAVNSEHYVDGSIDREHLSDDIINSTKIADDAVGSEHIQQNAVTDSEIATGTLDNRYFTETELNNGALDGRYYTESELDAGQLDNRYYTETEAEARFLRQDSSETIASGVTWSASDAFVATTAAIDLRVIELVDNVGGFVPIANETSFPTANPDINTSGSAKGGTIVSVQAASTDLAPSGTTVTIANGRGSGLPVIITGVSATIPSGFGFLVETTATDHTYAFHRLVPKATEVSTVAANATAIAAAGNNVTDINNFVDLYQISQNAPTQRADASSLQVGDLWFDSSSNKVLMVYDGSSGDGFSAVTPNQSDLTNINIVAGQLVFQEDLGLITDAVSTGTGNQTLNTVAGISSQVTTVAGIDTEITAVAADEADIGAVAAKATEIGRLGTADAVADLAILGTTDVVADMNTLATADIVADMNLLATSDVVADMALLATTDVIADMALLAVPAVITDMSILATTDVVADMAILGTADVVADMNLLAVADVISDMNTLATSANVTAMSTCATNITDINTFANRYRIASSAPSTSLDQGDLYFDTTQNELKVYNGGAWQGGVTATGNLASVNASNTFAADQIIGGDLTISSAKPELFLTDTNSNSDYIIQNDDGTFKLRDDTNSDAVRYQLGADGAHYIYGNTNVMGTSNLTVGGNLDVDGTTELDGLNVAGNITVTGTVDGRDLATDGSKLDAIEAAATADQTASEIVALIAGQTIAPNVITTTNLTLDFGSIA